MPAQPDAHQGRQPETPRPAHRGRAGPDIPPAPEAPALPAPTSLAVLGDARLQGRANAPVRVAAMQAAQQTVGNRALQRLLQRPLPAVQRAPAPTESAPAAGSAATSEAASGDASKDARYKAFIEQERLRLVAEYRAEAEEARADGQREIDKYESLKVRDAEDPMQFLHWAAAQYSPRFIAEALEAEADALLHGRMPPLDGWQRHGQRWLARRMVLLEQGQARARAIGMQEYHIYWERAKGRTTPGPTTDKEHRDEWRANRSADTAEWIKSRPLAADFAAQQSPLRDALGPLGGDLLAAESQSNVLRAAAIKLLPDLAPLVALWSVVQRAAITLSTPEGGPEQDPPPQGAAAAMMAKEPLRQEAAAAMTAFGAALPALGQGVLHDLLASYRAAMVEHLQRTSVDLAAQLRTAYTPKHLAGFAPRFRELTDILDQYIALRLHAQQKKGGAQAEAMGRTADQLAHFGSLAAHLAELREDQPDAERVPAVFYPEREFDNVGQPGVPQFQAKGIPWVFYLSHAQKEFGGQQFTVWELVDMTSPRHIKANTQVSGPPTSGDKQTPPDDLFAQLNSALRFPRGELWLQLPNGQHRRIITTAPWQVSELLQWLGLALGMLALAAATGGASVPATILVVGGGMVTAAGAVADLAEKSKQGMLTSKDIVVDALAFAGALAAAEQGMGKFFVAKSLQEDGRFAALARLHGRVGRTFHMAGTTANMVSLAIMARDVWHEFDELSKITDEKDRKLAQGRLVSNLLLSGALTIVQLGMERQARRAGTEPRSRSETLTGTSEATTTETGSSQNGGGQGGGNRAGNTEVIESNQAGSDTAGDTDVISPATNEAGSSLPGSQAGSDQTGGTDEEEAPPWLEGEPQPQVSPHDRQTPKANYFPAPKPPAHPDSLPPQPHPQVRRINASMFDAVPIPQEQGRNTGKLRLIHRRKGLQFMFKPLSGEQHLVGAHEGIIARERYRRQAAASYVGRQAGIDVPRSWVVEYNGQIGSLQEWVENGETLAAIRDDNPALYQQIENSQAKRDLEIFDYLIGNMDRGTNLGNWMVAQDPAAPGGFRMPAIDSDNSFPSSPVRMTFDESPTMRKGQTPLPATISRDLLMRLRFMGADRAALRQALVQRYGYLNEAEVNGMLLRLDEILGEARWAQQHPGQGGLQVVQ